MSPICTTAASRGAGNCKEWLLHAHLTDCTGEAVTAPPKPQSALTTCTFLAAPMCSKCIVSQVTATSTGSAALPTTQACYLHRGAAAATMASSPLQGPYRRSAPPPHYLSPAAAEGALLRRASSGAGPASGASKPRLLDIAENLLLQLPFRQRAEVEKDLIGL